MWRPIEYREVSELKKSDRTCSVYVDRTRHSVWSLSLCFTRPSAADVTIHHPRADAPSMGLVALPVQRPVVPQLPWPAALLGQH
jgi:hypothetical protein